LNRENKRGNQLLTNPTMSATKKKKDEPVLYFVCGVV